MNIFCGFQATGRGHYSRYSVIRDLIAAREGRTYGFACGQSIPAGATDIDEFCEGPTFFIAGNRIAFWKSARYNTTRLNLFRQAIGSLADHLRRTAYDDLIIDFEPISARAARRAKRNFTVFDNQTFAFLPMDAPPRIGRYLRGMRGFVLAYYGNPRKARKVLTYSLAPAVAALPNQIIVPPCVRGIVRDLRPRVGQHLLFYSSIGELPPGLIEFTRGNPNAEVRAYVGTDREYKDLPDNLIVRRRDTNSFLEDFETCRGFVANAGFESLAEAVTLDKPVTVVPISGQWEQEINAHVVEKERIGLVRRDFSAATFAAAWDHEVTAPAEIKAWAESGRARLEEALFRGMLPESH
jgi:uncharacterized protein (TIGR00661 family)